MGASTLPEIVHGAQRPPWLNRFIARVFTAPNIVAIIALLIPLLLIMRSQDSPWKEPAHEVAMALLLFALLTLTFEGITRGRITEHVQTTVRREVDALDTSLKSSIDTAVQITISAIETSLAKSAEQMTRETNAATARKILSSLVGEMGYDALEPFLKRVSIWRPAATLTVAISDPGVGEHFDVDLDFVTEVKNEDDNQAEYRLVIKEESNYGGLGQLDTARMVLKWNKQSEKYSLDRAVDAVQAVSRVVP